MASYVLRPMFGHQFGSVPPARPPSAAHVPPPPSPYALPFLTLLTDQRYSSNKTALGFSVLFLNKTTDARNVDLPQINRAKFFANVGAAVFAEVETIDVDRTARFGPHDPNNPVEKLFDW